MNTTFLIGLARTIGWCLTVVCGLRMLLFLYIALQWNLFPTKNQIGLKMKAELRGMEIGVKWKRFWVFLFLFITGLILAFGIK